MLCCEGVGVANLASSGQASVNAAHAQLENMLELLLEKFDAPACYLAKNPSMAAFAAGRATALVVDCGGGGATCVPVLDGLVFQRPGARSCREGEWLTSQVQTRARV